MAAAEAANKTSQAATAVASDSNDNAIHPPAKKLIDPQLLMAARRGNSKRIKELLRLNIEEVESHGRTGSNGGGVVESAASAGAVILEVAPDGPPAAPATPPPPPPLVDGDGVTIEGDTLLHVVAACGNGDDFIDCAKMIVGDKKRKGGADAVRLALEARNREGDTPLHCAAGAGNASMICCLVDLIASETTDDEAAGAEAKKALVRTQNECGETALHQAIRAARNKEACIDQLMGVDPELACIPHEDGASPLYLAISLGEIEIAKHLYVKSNGKLSYSGPDGQNVLHAAVHRGQALSKMILEWLKDTKPKEDSSSVSLVWQLTSQREKKHEGSNSTPLHLATSLSWGCQIAGLLLDANESTAYQADDEGSYPIHVAAWSGLLSIVELLLERCPDCTTLRDGKARTFLHVAAEKERHNVVQYVCGEMPKQLSSMILNAQDSNGDTTLHYAVRAGNLAVFNCLLRNPRVRLDVANKDGMTPLDLSGTMIPPGFRYAYNPVSIVYFSLSHVGAPRGRARPTELLKHIPKRDLDEESKKHTEATQVMSIVTALIATITFASAFQLPGGYRSANDAAGAAGTPVLAGSYAFDAFILADTLAFICSITATYFLVYAGVPAMDISIRFRYFSISSNLMGSAARSLVAAFGLGLYLVVHHTASAIVACAIVFASSIYGNIEVWLVIRLATTVFARVGFRRDMVVAYARVIFSEIFSHFWSYIIIFGLPAIRKRIH